MQQQDAGASRPVAWRRLFVLLERAEECGRYWVYLIGERVDTRSGTAEGPHLLGWRALRSQGPWQERQHPHVAAVGDALLPLLVA